MANYKCPNGHTVTVTNRLCYMPSATSGYNVYINGRIELMSYETVVINIDHEGWLTCTGTYSNTTRRHIAAFLKECAPNLTYHDAKRAYEDYHKINIHTGEIVSL